MGRRTTAHRVLILIPAFAMMFYAVTLNSIRWMDKAAQAAKAREVPDAYWRVAADENNIMAWRSLLGKLDESGRDDESYLVLRHVHEKFPDQPDLEYNFGRLCFMRGKDEEAEKCLRNVHFDGVIGEARNQMLKEIAERRTKLKTQSFRHSATQ